MICIPPVKHAPITCWFRKFYDAADEAAGGCDVELRQLSKIAPRAEHPMLSLQRQLSAKEAGK